MATRSPDKTDQYQIENRGTWRIIRVHENVDFQRDFSWLLGLVDELCAEEKPQVALVFDRKAFMHSKLIAVLVACSRKVKASNGVLALVEPGPHVVSTLKVMKLIDTVVKVYPSEHELT